MGIVKEGLRSWGLGLKWKAGLRFSDCEIIKLHTAALGQRAKPLELRFCRARRCWRGTSPSSARRLIARLRNATSDPFLSRDYSSLLCQLLVINFNHFYARVFILIFNKVLTKKNFNLIFSRGNINFQIKISFILNFSF